MALGSMDELSHVLSAATQAIDSAYFHIQIDGGDPIYRERVYCYELYHQMRRLWPDGCAYRLNGELDKAAHPILSQWGADRKKPDLLVHQPGSMAGNHAVIEVKSSRASANGIEKDLETLSLFITKVGYQRAIYLLYGYEADMALVKRIQSIASTKDDRAQIELWLHDAPGKPAACVGSV